MLTPPNNSKTALRNLMVVLLVAAGFILYSYGWTVTNIDLAKPQEPARQEGVGRALQELLSPNLFDQDSETDIFGAQFRYTCDSGELPAPAVPQAEGAPVLRIEPACGDPNTRIAFSISGLPAGARAAVRWVTTGGEGRPRDVFETADARRGRNQFFINTDGTYSGYLEAPRISGASGEVHTIELGVVVPVGSPYMSSTLTEVLRRMVETIFMALMATTISIPISVGLSFFAAHNLMKPIRMPLGSAMLWMALLPFAYGLGAWLLGGLSRLSFDLGSGRLLTAGLPALLGVGLLAGTVAATSMRPLSPDAAPNRVRQIGMRLLVMAVVAVVIGFIGGFGLSGQAGLTDLASRIDPAGENLLAWALNSIGRMLGILGGMVDLALPVTAGLIGALMLPGLAVDLVKPVLKSATGLLDRGLGAVLGAFSGAFALGGVAVIAMGAALLGLLPPLVAGLLGRSVAQGVFNLVVPVRPAYQTTTWERLARTLVGWVGMAAAFVVTFGLLNVGQTLIDGTLPPIENSSLLGLSLPTYVLTAMGIGMVLGASSGALSGVRGTFAVGDLLYNITRNVLNALRSIEPLIMALVFVVWVGIGPFAGVLALTLHSIASLGKLYSEQIETIDNGPIEALQSTGANHLQTIVYAVVPQIVPPYIAFTMYRWDINVRMSTIIGFVGGGGIGLLLNQYINLLRYSDAGVAVLAIAIVVSILDFASASIRERVL
jgi:phosphonate ABC transporter permease subunit PhnE